MKLSLSLFYFYLQGMNWIFNIVSRFFVFVFLYYGFVLVGSIIYSSIFLFECVIMFWQTQPSFWAIYPQEWQASNFSLWYHSWFKHKSHENVWNDHQLGKLLIVKQLSLSERNIFFEWMRRMKGIISVSFVVFFSQRNRIRFKFWV